MHLGYIILDVPKLGFPGGASFMTRAPLNDLLTQGHILKIIIQIVSVCKEVTNYISVKLFVI